MPNPLFELIQHRPPSEMHFGGYTFVEVSDPDTLVALFRQRHDVYVSEGFIEMNAFPEGCFRDAFDPLATHIAALDADDNVIGSSRVVPPSSLGLPTDRLFRLPPLEVPHRLIGEVGRLSVLRPHRGRARNVMLGLIARIYDALRGMGLSHFVAFMHPDLMRLLNAIRVPVRPLTPLPAGAAELKARGMMRGYFSRAHVSPTLCDLDEMARAIGVPPVPPLPLPLDTPRHTLLSAALAL